MTPPVATPSKSACRFICRMLFRRLAVGGLGGELLACDGRPAASQHGVVILDGRAGGVRLGLGHADSPSRWRPASGGGWLARRSATSRIEFPQFCSDARQTRCEPPRRGAPRGAARTLRRIRRRNHLVLGCARRAFVLRARLPPPRSAGIVVDRARCLRAWLDRENPAVRRLVRAGARTHVEHGARVGQRSVETCREPRVRAARTRVRTAELLIIDAGSAQVPRIAIDVWLAPRGSL